MIPLRRSLAAAILALALISGCASSEERGGRSQPVAQVSADAPNVILIMTDDQTVSDVRAMPYTQELFAKRGVRFTSAYASFPLCCPSRVSFLTGQYAHNHGVMSNIPKEGGGFPAFDDEGSLAPTLDAAGYQTGVFGKYLNGYGRRKLVDVKGWDRWVVRIRNSYYDYLLDVDGQKTGFGSRPGDYITNVLTRYARKFILSSSPAPYFAWFSHAAPHVEDVDGVSNLPPRPAPEDRRRFRNAKLGSPAISETDLSDKPSAVTALNPDALTNRERLRVHRARLRTLLAVDRSVRRIWSAVKSSGEANNTYLFFVSDNGYLLGEHGLDGKSVFYDESARIPFRVIGPGFTPGRVRSEPIMNVDFAPTVYDATGVKPGLPFDGLSLLRPLDENRALLLESLASAGVQTNDYLYTEHPDSEVELYDMAADPYQLESVHDDPAYADVRAELSATLDTMRACSGESCVPRGP